MKKFVGRLLALGIVFLAAFYLGGLRKESAAAKAPTLLFAPSAYPKVNHPFVVLIVGSNNGAWLQKTLQSAFYQNYPNFRIIYIDDASDDGSFDLAKDLIQESSLIDQIMLLRNETKLGLAPNLARAIASCSPQEIVVVLGGEDWLAHEWVLSRLNQYYANPDLWMTYGQAKEYPSYTLGQAKIADANVDPRRQPFFAGPLHSFYADLFQRINPEHLAYPAAVQQAYMLPMLEMAGAHATFIPEILYIANKMGTKEQLELSQMCEKSIRSLGAYASIVKRPLEEITEEAP